MNQGNAFSFLCGCAAVGILYSMMGLPAKGPTSPISPTLVPLGQLDKSMAMDEAPASPGSEESAELGSESEGSVSFHYAPIELENEPIQPIPEVEEFFEDYLEIDYEGNVIALGKQLFHDPRLSADNTLSCASCHDLRYAGIDRATTATGVRGQVGAINTPTVFNSAFNFVQFWDGRAHDLVAQADGPPNAPGEMASNWQEIASKLGSDDQLMELVALAWPDEDFSEGVDQQFWLDAIAMYEFTLITPDAPFDQYLEGDSGAISKEAKEGYQLFKDIGCIECHSGMAVGGKSFQRLGRRIPYFDKDASGPDLGRYNVTEVEEDRHAFKVPLLRNVSLTGPWFHDGSQLTLGNAVHTMGLHQLDMDLSQAQVERIVSFLETLTGEHEGQSLNDIQN